MSEHERYARALRRLEKAQNLHCECTYFSTTEKSIVKLTGELLEDAKAEVSDALKCMNEAILKARGTP